MSIFNVLTLFGGLAMFLYGMRLMGDGLKESSSGTLKVAMEHVTNNAFKAFLLGVAVTAIIQSSTATIVITSGLVAAGIISLKQSLGIVVGANVGTTVTGQIIRLLDIDNSAGAILQFFKPSTLAPIALIIGIVAIMGFKSRKTKTIGSIAIGFGILFSGLLNMTSAVNTLAETGVFDALFAKLGSNPVIGYLIGAAVAFILQSSSATIGILQTFSMSGHLTFNAIYAVIVGVYLGDCVTTAIVCSIGAKAEAKRVGLINILYNLSKSVLVLAVIAILKMTGVLDGIWNDVVNPGYIADTNSIFNLVCALLLLPMLPIYFKLGHKIVKDDPVSEDKYKDQLDELSPAFFATPALALRGCYDCLLTMFYAARRNIETAFELLERFDPKAFAEVEKEEDNIDHLADRISEYLVELSARLTADLHVTILNQYYKVVPEFERLGDHAMNIAETAADLHERNVPFSGTALEELNIMEDLIGRILDETEQTFKKRDIEAAYRIEPLEEVVDDLVLTMKNNHLRRLSIGACNIYSGTDFMDLLADIERISDICSNVGLATVTRVNPDLANKTHDYAYFLHSGRDEFFNQEYKVAHDEFYGRLDELIGEGKIQN